MNLYPLFMAPHFRSGDETPWGGNMLRDAFMKDAPEQTGESYEISAVSGCESLIRSGEHAGKTLNKLVETWGNQLTGGEIAMHLKLVDAAEALPEQSGNAKAWVVLNCEAGCKLVCGDEEKCLRPGDVYYIPAGVTHAVNTGIQLYEICATKETPAGSSAKKVFGTTSLCKGGSRTYYAANECFEFCRLNLSGKMPLHDGRMHFITPLAPCTLRWDDGEAELMPLESVLIPAELENVFIESEDCKLLCASPADREWLRAELGYRAENVAALADEA